MSTRPAVKKNSRRGAAFSESELSRTAAAKIERARQDNETWAGVADYFAVGGARPLPLKQEETS